MTAVAYRWTEPPQKTTGINCTIVRWRGFPRISLRAQATRSSIMEGPGRSMLLPPAGDSAVAVTPRTGAIVRGQRRREAREMAGKWTQEEGAPRRTKTARRQHALPPRIVGGSGGLQSWPWKRRLTPRTERRIAGLGLPRMQGLAMGKGWHGVWHAAAANGNGHSGISS